MPPGEGGDPYMSFESISLEIRKESRTESNGAKKPGRKVFCPGDNIDSPPNPKYTQQTKNHPPKNISHGRKPGGVGG